MEAAGPTEYFIGQQLDFSIIDTSILHEFQLKSTEWALFLLISLNMDSVLLRQKKQSTKVEKKNEQNRTTIHARIPILYAMNIWYNIPCTKRPSYSQPGRCRCG